VRARVTRSFLEFLARYPHVSGELLVRGAGLDPAVLGDPEALHSVRSILSFLESAARVSGDDCFGLEFGAQLPVQDLDVLGYVMLHSPTLGAGFENTCRYYAVQQTLGRLVLTRGAVNAQLTYELPVPRGVRTGQLIDVIFAVLTRYARQATGKPRWSPRQVRFTHPAPSNPLRFERFFRASARFGQPVNALLFRRTDLDLPLESPDPGLLPILERHARDLLARLPRSGTFADTARRLVAELLGTGNVAIETVAARLHMTPRSLQRRLQEDGSSYQQLLAETRLALAQRYLDTRTLPLTEVAFLLGYSELSAFSRAFRRWTGQSPLRFRRRHGR
jgi:AraC-like DNA-binding protein